MADNIFHMVTGKEQTRGASANLGVYICPVGPTSLTKQSHFAYALKKECSGIAEIGRSQKTMAAPGKIDDYGHWWEGNYKVSEGIILRVVGQRTTGGHGDATNRACIFVEARSTAALTKIWFRCTRKPEMGRDDAWVQGRFDILTEEEIDQRYPNLIPYFARRDLMERHVRSTFSIEKIAPATRAKARRETKRTKNIFGDEVVIPTLTKGRRINMRGISPANKQG